MPLAKLSFSAYVICRKRSANQPKKLQNKVFPVKTSLPKISLILQKMKIGQKSDRRRIETGTLGDNKNLNRLESSKVDFDSTQTRQHDLF